MSVVDAPGGVEVDLDALASTLQENPLLAVAGLLLVVAVVGTLWAVRRYLTQTQGDRFVRALDRADAVAVLMHPGPDPDAMSSALGVAELARSRDVEPTLYYSGEIRHQENRAFQTVLDKTFEKITSADEIAEDEIVLVDHNTARGFTGAETIEPLAVVDHHPGNGTGSTFTDVRTDRGACATLLTEYFDSLGYEPVGPDEVDELESREGVLEPWLSTALLYGIQADTNNLTNGCSLAEFEAASYLYQGIDEEKLDRIANPDMDAESLDVKARAILDREVRAPFAVSDVGTVSNADSVPQAAEELRRLEGVSAVVVLAEKDGVIRLSGRSDDDRVHMGNTLEAVVKDIPMSSAGGHARMGGGQVSTEHMTGLGGGERFDREALKDRLFAGMNGDL